MIEKIHTWKRRMPLCLALSVILAWPAALAAQEVELDEEGEVIRLSAFRVDTQADEGYRATNTISGTRLDTPIRDVPMPIEVITSDFIDDIGAIDMREALAFSSGVLLDSTIAGFGDPGGAPSFDFSPSGFGQGMGPDQIKMRGFTTNTQLRSGLKIQGPIDTANVARLEVVRGPAALLYGVTILGGVVNVLPKRPLETPQYDVRHTMGSFDLHRTVINATGPLFQAGNVPVNYQLAGVYQQIGEMRDFRKTRDVFFAPTVEFHPLENTNVLMDFEYLDRKLHGIGDPDFSVGFLPNNEFNEGALYIRDVSPLNHLRHNIRGADTWETEKRYNAVVEVEQFVGDNFTAAFAASDSKVEQRALRNNMGVNTLSVSAADELGVPMTARTVAPGNQIRTISVQWQDGFRDHRTTQTRLDLNYEFELFGNRQNILLGRQDVKDDISWSDFGWSGQQWKPFGDFSPAVYQGHDGDTDRFRDLWEQRWNTGHYLVGQVRAFDERLQIIGGNRWDRWAVRQVRWHVENSQRTEIENGRWWNAGVDFGTPQFAPVREGFRFDGRPVRDTSPTIGVSYRVNEPVTVYALSAGGMFPNAGQRDGKGEGIDNEQTRSLEAGIKMDFFEGRVSGTISVFRIDRENAVWFYSFASAPRWNNDDPGRFERDIPISFGVPAEFFPEGFVPHAGEEIVYRSDRPVHVNEPGQPVYTVLYDRLDEDPVLRQAMDAFFEDPGYWPVGGNSNNPSHSRGTDVTFGDRSRGLDAQFIFSPLDNWQLTANYAYIKRTVNQGFELRDFIDPVDGVNYATEYDVWLHRLGGSTGRSGVNESFADPFHPSTFDGGVMIGAQLDDSPRHAWSFWNNYTFQEGVLNGLSVRLGAIFSGERITTPEIGGGNLAANVLRRPEAKSDLEWRGGLAYNTQLGDYRLRFNLAVNNILDRQKSEATVTRTHPDTGESVQRRTVQYFTPRTWRLTASLLF